MAKSFLLTNGAVTAVVLCSHVFLSSVNHNGKIYPKGFLLPVEEGIPDEKLTEWEKRNLIKKIEAGDPTKAQSLNATAEETGKKPTAPITPDPTTDKKPVEEKK